MRDFKLKCQSKKSKQSMKTFAFINENKLQFSSKLEHLIQVSKHCFIMFLVGKREKEGNNLLRGFDSIRQRRWIGCTDRRWRHEDSTGIPEGRARSRNNGILTWPRLSHIINCKCCWS